MNTNIACKEFSCNQLEEETREKTEVIVSEDMFYRDGPCEFA